MRTLLLTRKRRPLRYMRDSYTCRGLALIPATLTPAQLKFEVYDSDASGVKDLARHDFVGECVTTVANIVASRGQAQSLALVKYVRGRHAQYADMV
jgi:hypothetical protein